MEGNRFYFNFWVDRLNDAEHSFFPLSRKARFAMLRCADAGVNNHLSMQTMKAVVWWFSNSVY
jgi:hypothetical protein